MTNMRSRWPSWRLIAGAPSPDLVHEYGDGPSVAAAGEEVECGIVQDIQCKD